MAGIAETPIHWVQIVSHSQITSGALSAGAALPAEAPALVYDKTQGLFSTADDVLGEVVEDIKSQVQFHDDSDWNVFPEIAELLAQQGIESSYTVAVCPSLGCWAIGVADGWKNRERAAKVALSVALTGSGSPGMGHGAGGGKRGGKGGGGKAGSGGGKGARKVGGGALGPQHHLPAPVAQSEGPIMWISVPHSSLAQSGLLPDAPVVSHDKSMGDILGAAAYILADLVPNYEQEVEIIHDPEWKTFPEIGEAIVQQGGDENCLCVATCPSQGKWGVGAAGSWKHQESTSKLALCIALVAGTDAIHGLQQSHPELAQACTMAGILPGRSGGGRGGGGRARGQQFAAAPPQRKRAWNGGNGGGAGPAMTPASDGGGEGAPVAWISVPPGSQLPQQGLIPDTCAIQYEKGVDVFSSAHSILSELVPELQEEVTFVHDADLDKYPEVAAAVQSGGMESVGQAVAVCSSINMWAVGLAFGWKDRERAAKLALSVRIASGTENMEALAANYPDFAAFVNRTGLVEGAEAASQPWAPHAPMHGGGGNKRRRFQEQAPPGDGKGGGKGRPPVSKGLSPLPRDAPVWVQLEPSAPVHEALENMPLEALAVSTQGGCRQLYACVDKVLVKLLETPDTEVQYIDDPDGTVFGSVGEALQQITDEQCQITVAICTTYGTWAIGVGNKWKDRQNAAKVALATLLSVRSCEVGLAPDLSEFPPICDFVEKVKPMETA